MLYKRLLIALLSVTGGLYAQVGIGTTTPNALLEISPTNPANPANTDGLIIPKINTFPTTNPTTNQQGMLVYLTTTSGGNASGFYYWNNTSTSWIALAGSQMFDKQGTEIRPSSTIDMANDDFVFGSPTVNYDMNYDHSSRFYYDKDKGAFRAGYEGGWAWADASRGNYSVAFGYDTEASGEASAALGLNTDATGYGSFAWGNWSAATGNYATAGGRGTDAPSAYEFAIGSFNTQYTPSSSVNWLAGSRAFVIGNGTSGSNRSNALIVYKNGRINVNDSYTLPNTDGTAGQALTTDGSGTITWGTPDAGIFQVASNLVSPKPAIDLAQDDFVFGSTQLDDNGNTNHDNRLYFDKSKGAFRAGGSGNNFWDDAYRGDYSFAGGYSTRSGGRGSVAFGQYGNSSGDFGASFGNQTTASGYASTAFGMYNGAMGNYSLAHGYNTVARGSHSTVWGSYSIAEANFATAWGHYAYATGNYSTAWGQRVTSYSGYETVVGRYNTVYTPASTTGWNTNDRLFVVANGSSSANRSNALTIMKDGDIGIGIDNPVAKVDIRPRNHLYGVYIDHNKTNGGGSYGLRIDLDNTGNSNSTAIGAYIDVYKNSATNAAIQGVFAAASDRQSGNGYRYAYGARGYVYTYLSNGTSTAYGIHGSAYGNADNRWAGFFLGNVFTNGTYNTSDRNLKKQIRPFTGALGQLEKIDVKRYQFKTEEYPLLSLPEGDQIGLISQDVEKVFPNMVKKANSGKQLVPKADAEAAGWSYEKTDDKDLVLVGKETEILSINYTNLVPVLIQATKEQQEIIQEQNKKIELLEQRLARLEALIDK